MEYQEAANKALLKGYENIKYRIAQREQSIRQSRNLPKLSEGELNEFLNENSNTLNGAMVVTNPHTGEVLALIGGVDHSQSSFNRATQANRQFGSAVKPFVYQLAFDKGYSPAEIVIDSPKRFGKWVPNNDSRKYLGPVSMQTALEKSLNIPTIDTAQKITESSLYSGLQQMGFSDFPHDLTVVLGSLSVSPIKAAMQYSLFSNYGTIVKPYIVAKIVAPNGKETIFQTTQTKITDDKQSYLVISILKNIIQRGTGHRARVSGIELAGKTGTSNLSRDVWFCGFAPDLQVIVWYGRDDNTSIGGQAYGGNVAAPVFADFISEALKINPGMRRNFRIPSGVYQKRIGNEIFYYTDISRINYEQLEETNRLINSEDENLFGF